MSANTQAWIPADWPAPPGIRAGTTSRLGGHSAPPYASFNLAAHVGDDPARVRANRMQLLRMLDLSAEPCWLEQQHGSRVALAGRAGPDDARADAALSSDADVVCAVLTADCVPLLLCDTRGAQVAAVHAGWRGLAAGIIQSTVSRFSAPADQLLAWLGPAIGPRHYEVGRDVARILSTLHASAPGDLQPTRPGHWLADLCGLARGILREAGVSGVYGGNLCTYADPARFYSHRREGKTGRMASLVWRGAAPSRTAVPQGLRP